MFRLFAFLLALSNTLPLITAYRYHSPFIGTRNDKRVRSPGKVLFAANNKEQTSASRKSVIPQRLIKAVIISGITAKALALEPLLTLNDATKYLLLSTAMTSCALRRIEDCYSYGYGGSLVSFAASNSYSLASFIEESGFPVSTAARLALFAAALHALTYFSYGTRIAAFIHKRNNSKSYKDSPRYKSFEASDKKIATGRRVSVWLSTSLLLGLFYALPLHLNIKHTLSKTTPKKSSLFSIASSTVALAAVGVQAVADNQKLNYKEKRASVAYVEGNEQLPPFCREGLYARWRHPNYAADFVFHCGVFLAALPACKQWHSGLLAFIGPAIFASIIRSATTLLEKRQKEAYTGTTSGVYEQWFNSTRRFF